MTEYDPPVADTHTKNSIRTLQLANIKTGKISSHYSLQKGPVRLLLGGRHFAYPFFDIVHGR